MPELTIVTFNSHGGVGPRTHAPYPLASHLCEWAADVVVVQECWRPDVGRAEIDIAHEQRGGQLHEISFGRGVVVPRPLLERTGKSNEKSNGRFSLAVLTRFSAEVVGELHLRRVRLDPLTDRRALHLRLDVDGHPLDLVALHTTSRLPHGPLLQLQSLVPQLPPPATPTVVAGDFNFWATGVDRVFSGWQRSVRGATWPTWRPHSQIDHLLVRPGDVEVLGGEVLENVGSDHAPIRARLRIA